MCSFILSCSICGVDQDKTALESSEALPKKDPVANSDAAKSDGEYINIRSSGGGVVALGGYGDETKEHGLISYYKKNMQNLMSYPFKPQIEMKLHSSHCILITIITCMIVVYASHEAGKFSAYILAIKQGTTLYMH